MGDITRPAIRPRRNVRLIAVGVLAICLGGLGAALLYVNVSSAVPVIAVKRTIYRDQVITADDLSITSLAPPPGLATVSGDQLGEIVGKTALTDLPAGGLLAAGSVGEPAVAPGAVRVGLRLEPGRLPATPLLPGTSVLLVPVAKDGAAAPSGPSVGASVASLTLVQTDGSSLLDVTVAQDSGERVAQLATAGQLAIIRLPVSPR